MLRNYLAAKGLIKTSANKYINDPETSVTYSVYEEVFVTNAQCEKSYNLRTVALFQTITSY